MSNIKRVVFCTYPCLYSSLVLSDLLRSPNIEIVAVVASTRNLKAKENKLVSDIQRIKVSGIHYSLYLLIVTQLYRFFPSFFKQKNFQTLCSKSQIDVLSTSNINAPDLQEKIRNTHPDFIFCAHFNQLIHPKTYNIAKEAAINLHPSLLPDLKGVDPAFYALSESYTETGVTIHHLAEDFDTGKVINQKMQTIASEDTLLSLNTKLFKLGTELFIDYLSSEHIQAKLFSSKNTDRYDSWPSKLHVKKFKQHRNFVFYRSKFLAYFR